MGFLEDEIDRLKEENRTQHEQILALQSQLQDSEDKMHKVGFMWIFNSETVLLKLEFNPSYCPLYQHKHSFLIK